MTRPRMTLRIGTRGSALALVQAQMTLEALRACGVAAVIETIVTDGDRRTPDTSWGEGAFVGAIEAALLSGAVDIAVHSAKDVPTDEDPRLTIAAFLPREWPEDVLVLPTGQPRVSLQGLPDGARVGTDSPRRTAFLRAVRPDLRVHPLHGNVDTRLRRLDAGETDALVLAAAGLRRLGRAGRISQVLDFAAMPSAPGQGALALQIRADDAATRRAVEPLDDAATRRSVEAERRLLQASGGGCRAPVGVLGRIVDGHLDLRAGFASADGRVAVTAAPAPDAAVIAGETHDDSVVAAVLADLTTRAIGRAAADPQRPRVVVTRPLPDAIGTVLALIDQGMAPLVAPTIAFAPPAATDVDRLTAACHTDAKAAWVVLTSARAVQALVDHVVSPGADDAALTRLGSRWAAVGAATARAARAAGIPIDFLPDTPTGRALADGLPLLGGDRVVVPRGDLADPGLPRRLAERGAQVEEIVVYRTIEGPAASSPAVEAALASGPAAVVMASGSAVRGWLHLTDGLGLKARALAIPVVAIGPTTAQAARSHGLRVIGESSSPAPADIAVAVAAALENEAEESR